MATIKDTVAVVTGRPASACLEGTPLTCSVFRMIVTAIVTIGSH